jgi:hypothetical protein
MTKPTADQLALLDVPSSELDLIIGEAVVAGEFGAKDLTDAEKQSTARAWLEVHRKEFRRAICVDSPVRAHVSTAESMDRTTLFAGVMDAVATVTLGIPVPVAVLSARLVKYGLDKLCAEPVADAT